LYFCISVESQFFKRIYYLKQINVITRGPLGAEGPRQLPPSNPALVEPYGLLLNLFLYCFAIEITRKLPPTLQKLIERFLIITVFVFLPLDSICIDQPHKKEYDSLSTSPILMTLVSIPHVFYCRTGFLTIQLNLPKTNTFHDICVFMPLHCSQNLGWLAKNFLKIFAGLDRRQGAQLGRLFSQRTREAV